ncbi:MAG: hypothetical protein MUC66_06110 [Methanolinea sp.]|jgi:tRNA G37 N-methylase Trm5|nr:hypothetical protein [Methanolinea sp.]
MTLKDDLRGVLPDDLIQEIPSGFQVIGDVVILFLPPRLQEFGDWWQERPSPVTAMSKQW